VLFGEPRLRSRMPLRAMVTGGRDNGGMSI